MRLALAFALAAVCLASCGKDSPAGPSEGGGSQGSRRVQLVVECCFTTGPGVTISFDPFVMAFSEAVTMRFAVDGVYRADVAQWTSSDPTVVQIGAVTGCYSQISNVTCRTIRALTKDGLSTVTATYDGATASMNIRVMR